MFNKVHSENHLALADADFIEANMNGRKRYIAISQKRKSNQKRNISSF